jgi:hypothetical protein
MWRGPLDVSADVRQFDGGFCMDDPRAVLLAASREEEHETRVAHKPQQERIGCGEFFRGGNRDGLAPDECVSRDGFAFVLGESHASGGLVAFERGLDLLQPSPRDAGGIPPEPRLDKFKVLRINSRRPSFEARMSLASTRLDCSTRFRVRVNQFVRLDETVDLLQARAFEIVFAGLDARDFGKRDFHVLDG